MKQRAISSVGVVIVGIVPALLGSPVYSIVIALIALGALYELYRSFQRVGVRPSTWSGTLALIALFIIAGTDAPFLALMGAMTSYTLISLGQHLIKKDLTGSLTDWVFSLSGVLYVGFTMMHFVLIRRMQGPSDVGWVESADALIGDGGASLGLAWLLVVLTTTWLTDVFAYLVGRKYGTTKLLPHVSPGKTRAGAVAGLVAGTLTGGLAGYVFGVPVPLVFMFGVGAIIAVGAMIGDLAESLIKREIGIKDMGSIVPGHGGLLDRIDALLVTIPLTYYLAMFLNWQGWP